MQNVTDSTLENKSYRLERIEGNRNTESSPVRGGTVNEKGDRGPGTIQTLSEEDAGC